MNCAPSRAASRRRCCRTADSPPPSAAVAAGSAASGQRSTSTRKSTHAVSPEIARTVVLRRRGAPDERVKHSGASAATLKVALRTERWLLRCSTSGWSTTAAAVRIWPGPRPRGSPRPRRRPAGRARRRQPARRPDDDRRAHPARLAASCPPPSSADERPYPEGMPGQPLRIVLVEDSVLLREGLVRLFDEAGYVTAGALGTRDDIVDARAAMRAADVAILDVRLPPSFRDEGIRAALRLRAELPELGILVLSQYVEGVYARELLAAGDGGVGLPPEGPRDVAGGVHGCRAPRARARHGAGPARRARAARGSAESARRAHAARARRARAHGRGPQQREHRGAPVHRRRRRREERQRDLREARARGVRAPSIAACSP